jgi:hypothetical protein
MMWPPASDDAATLTVSRTMTLSFANARGLSAGILVTQAVILVTH